MAQIFGIRFAPVLIPIERRLQTFAVVFCLLLFLCQFSWLFIVTLLLLLPSQCCFIPLIYLVWYAYSIKWKRTGGCVTMCVRKWKLWTWFRDYYPIELVKSVDLNGDANYMFICHPHGVTSSGVFCNFATEATNFSQTFPGLMSHVLVLDCLFSLPFNREILLCLGILSASRESIDWLLTNGSGKALVLVVGGATESQDAGPNKMILTLAKRKGFIRAAMRHGTSLVPVLSFGENDTHNVWMPSKGSVIQKLQKLVTKKLSFSPTFFYGRGIFQYTFGILPRRTPITTIVGKPLEVRVNLRPSEEEVDAVHAQYVECLAKLFNDNRDKYATSQLKLVIK